MWKISHHKFYCPHLSRERSASFCLYVSLHVYLSPWLWLTVTPSLYLYQYQFHFQFFSSFPRSLLNSCSERDAKSLIDRITQSLSDAPFTCASLLCPSSRVTATDVSVLIPQTNSITNSLVGMYVIRGAFRRKGKEKGLRTKDLGAPTLWTESSKMYTCRYERRKVWNLLEEEWDKHGWYINFLHRTMQQQRS